MPTLPDIFDSTKLDVDVHENLDKVIAEPPSAHITEHNVNVAIFGVTFHIG